MSRRIAIRRRKYHVKSEKMIQHIVSCIKKLPKDEIKARLNDYEVAALSNLSKWARTAPIAEILVVVTKLGFPITIQMSDDRNPLQAYELHKATKELVRRNQFDKLIEIARTHNYFCLCGSQIMKEQGLYSLLVNGTIYKPNPETKHLLRAAAYNDERNQKSIDAFIDNVLKTGETGDLNFIDFRILWFIRRNDDFSVQTLTIHDHLAYMAQPNVIQSHLSKLTKHGYIQKFGIKKASSYILTPKAWQTLIKTKKEYFSEIRFFEKGHSIEILKENKINGTAISVEAEEKTVA